jgi:iron complex outermembrane receptor protein
MLWLRGASSYQNYFKSDSYYTMDASIAYQFQRYKLAATVKNLTDEQYFQSYGYFGGRVAPAQGVSAYVTFTVNY